MIDVSAVATVIASGGAAVGAVGVACLGVRTQIMAFRAVRAAGGSTHEAFAAGRQARKEAEFGGVTASGRQMEKDYEAMWAEKGKRG